MRGSRLGVQRFELREGAFRGCLGVGCLGCRVPRVREETLGSHCTSMEVGRLLQVRWETAPARLGCRVGGILRGVWLLQRAQRKRQPLLSPMAMQCVVVCDGGARWEVVSRPAFTTPRHVQPCADLAAVRGTAVHD